MRLFFLIFILKSFSVYASNVSCDASILKQDSLHNIPEYLYWMQSAGHCRITYTCAGSNVLARMYNLCSRSAEPITNEFDPVSFGDGEVYVHPRIGIDTPNREDGMSFYLMSETLNKNGKKIKPIYIDKSLKGDYQSIGVLSSNQNQQNIRILTQGDKLPKIRDYSIAKNTNGKIIAVSPIIQVKSICANLKNNDLTVQLPIISRNGKMISFVNNRSDETKIYEIKDKTYDCIEIGSINAPTSKTSFGFDNNSLIYTIKDPLTQKGRLMKFDLKTKEIKTLSGPTENVSFMTTMQDGSIVYSKHVEKLEKGNLVKLSKFDLPNNVNLNTKEFLGYLWAEYCNLKIDADSAQLVGHRMTSDACTNIVSEQFEKSKVKNRFSNLTDQQLRSFCMSDVSPEKSSSKKDKSSSNF